MWWVLRRSIPSLGMLVALVLAVGVAFVHFLGVPVWFPGLFAVVVLAIQYAINPVIVEWLIPAQEIAHDGTQYSTDHWIGELVARRCRDAGIPLVKLGIVDDGTPNAFAFGRVRRDARVWISRGIFERLDEREVDAVVTHEIGHVRNYDFAVMTVAAVIPMVLYMLYCAARTSGNHQARAVAIGAYVAYVASQFCLLGLSRAREYGADRWSCRCTGDGDALASALVKIAYGIGQVDAERRERIENLKKQGGSERKEAARLTRRAQRAQAFHAMGIFDPVQAESMSVALSGGIDPDRAIQAMRYEAISPWPGVLEKLSTHPIVSRRIRALERSRLPGAPRIWNVLRRAATATTPADRRLAHQRFHSQLAVALLPWVLFIPGLVTTPTNAALGAGLLVAAGFAFCIKQAVRYPTQFERVEGITSLLDRMDAGPVAGIPVEIHGWISGRGVPGYVLSPDLVVADHSGFVPVLYRSSIPLAGLLFGLLRARSYVNQYVTVRGWFLRLPGPVLELESIESTSDRSTGIEWITRWVASVAVIAVGISLYLAAMF